MRPAGVIFSFAEPDYCYGVGPLLVRIEKVDPTPVWYDGENWYWLDGVQMAGAGVEVTHRRVLVRGRRLPPSLLR